MVKNPFDKLTMAVVVGLAFSGCGGGGGGTATPAAGTISGRVLDTLDSRNYPVVGAWITAGSATAVTGEDGGYSMQVPSGTYTITMQAGQYVPSSISRTVETAGSVTVDFATTPATTPAMTVFGESGTGVSGLNTPVGMFEGSDQLIHIADRGNNRIQVLDPSTGLFVRNYGKSGGAAGSGLGEFSSPNYLVMDSADGIYVTDGSNHRIQSIVPGATPTYQTWNCNGEPLPASTPAWYPRGMAWGPQQELYVVSPWFNNVSGNSLCRFDPDGNLISQTALPTGTQPMGLAIDIQRNRMYIGDFTNGPGVAGRVLLYNYTAGTWTRGDDIVYPASAPAPADFGVVEGLWVDSNGYLWVVDAGSADNRIVKFDSAGHWIMTVDIGSFTSPRGVLIDRAGSLWVSGGDSTGWIRHYPF